jgi:thymidylate synthase
MEWPIFYRELLSVGNTSSCVAICTLWTQKELICKDVPRDMYCVCANLYTPSGISFIIKNVLANPRIRYIVMCGKDLSQSGDALLNLMKNGMDGNKIIGCEATLETGVSPEMLKMFRESVSLIDMRGKEDQILDVISDLPRKEAFSEPIVVEEESSQNTALTPENVFLIRSKTISESWLKILDIIMKFGEEKMSEYHMKQKEVLDLVAVVDGKEEKIAPYMRFDDKALKEYCLKFFNSERPEGISYTYGERLFKYPLLKLKEKWTGELASTFDQIDNVIEHLRKTPYTRRAIAFTWNIDIDSESENPPCLTQITWSIKGGLLYQTSIIRSNDMFGAWPMNAFALREIQEKIAARLGIGAGPLVMISNSAHIYENNWRECRDIIKKNYSGDFIQFEQDAMGYFTISLRDGEIFAEHKLSDGSSSGFSFCGTDASEIYRRILHENLVSRLDHASYLGMELFRAQDALSSGKEYVQG